MAIKITDLDQLDAATVQERARQLATMLQEKHPTIDVRTGGVRSLVIDPAAEMAVARDTEMSRLIAAGSLKAVSEDPTLAETELVDALMSNYRISRRQGSAARGELTIVVSKLAAVTIPSGNNFSANGKTFYVQTAFVARTSATNVLSATDRLLTPVGDGTYSFTVSVVAAEAGSSSMLKKGDAVQPLITLSNFVKAYATSDFVDGSDTETNAELVERAQLGMSTKALSGRLPMMALLQEQFPLVVDSSIIGNGDVEMVRDKHSIIPGSFGGRADWYVRSRQKPQRLGMTKTATLVQKTSDGKGIWQISLGRNEAPGFYDVKTIVAKGATNFVGSYRIVKEVRTIDRSPIYNEHLPDIVSLKEGAFSRYQAAVIQFLDHDTDSSALTVGTSTKEYDITVRVMPDIAEIQSVMSSRKHRNYGGDLLVRAAIPCFVSIGFTLEAKPGEPLPDPYAIKDDIANFINTSGFCGRLPASAISDLVHGHLSGKIMVSAIDMHGQILRPSGTVRDLRSTETLIVPDETDELISARTVVFIVEQEDILISARTVNIPEI